MRSCGAGDETVEFGEEGCLVGEKKGLGHAPPLFEFDLVGVAAAQVLKRSDVDHAGFGAHRLAIADNEFSGGEDVVEPFGGVGMRRVEVGREFLLREIRTRPVAEGVRLPGRSGPGSCPLR